MHLIPVACLGLGPIGQRLARRLAGQAGVKLIGGVDTDIGRTGRDLGALLGRDDVDAAITEGVVAAPEGGVLVQATVSRRADAVTQATAAVRAGWNVVSTCEELVHRDGNAVLAELDRDARERGVTVVAAGINPGFLMDALPLVLSGVCMTVEHVRVRRVVDTDQRREPLQRKAGVGLSEAEFRARSAAGTLGHVGLRQSAELLATGLGWTVDDYAETLDPVLADVETETGLGRVPAGAALGQHQTVEVHSGGSLVISYDLQMSAGAPPVDEITIEGEPSVNQRIEGGINGDLGTVAVISNLVPAVAAAPPGFLTISDLLPLRARPWTR
jgi:4-hydroxy-tetrahydrodipicolinate reductase